MLVSTGATVSSAATLSGVDSFTLLQEPQQTPDGLGSSNLGALQYADPSSQIDLVQPPVANNQGDARVTFPISVPPGRAGVQPDLSLSYSSSAGNSWVGLGWDLSVGSVSVDTRWGVPRYSQAQESETYQLNGDQLSPTAVRSTLESRQPEKVFQRRVEGSFEHIVRHGTAPGNYWWEVTGKNGAHRYYGGTPEGGRDASAILTTNTEGNGPEFVWGLKQVRDISGNTVTYFYDKPGGTGVGAANAGLGQELYLSKILYTGSITSNTPDDPAYEVDLVRESRPDVGVDGRGGFLRVTSERLKQIVIKYRGSVVRSDTLNYKTGVFGKSLLTSVGQYGKDGTAVLATHTFDYYNDLNATGSTYQGFDANKLQTWNTQPDNVTTGVDLGGYGDGNASALGGSKSSGADGRLYLGFNLYSGQKEGSIGVGLTFAGEDDAAVLEMLDVNGDHLPDKAFARGGGIYYRPNQSGPNGTTTFGDIKLLPGLTHLSSESSFTFGVGPELYFFAFFMYNHAWSWQTGKAYFIDVNADGLPDFADQGTVYFDHLDANGNPYYEVNNADTAVPIDQGSIDTLIRADLSATAAQMRAQAPLQDVLRRWIAPYDGQVKIEGDVALLQPASGPTGDGVRVAIQAASSELWSATIDGGDYTPRTPTGVGNLTVTRGEAIYFRIQSRNDGASDQVSWDPTITYLNVPPTLDANGLDIYSYQASKDFTLAGRIGSYTLMPLNGTVRLAGDFVKSRATSDDVTIQVLQNSSVVFSQTIASDQTGTTPVSVDIPVNGPDPANSVPGDKIQLQLKIDSPVDLSAFSWRPKLYYTAATQKDSNGVEQPIPVGDESNPTIKLYPPVDTQIYPGTDQTGPQATWKAGNSGDQKISITNFSAASGAQGTLTLTVKKVVTPPNPGDAASVLVAKKTFSVQNGVIQDSDASLTFSADQNAEYLFDLSVAQATIGGNWSATLDPAVPFARHWAYQPTDVFPEAYRGWGIAGYNGDGQYATQPIDPSHLIFNKDDYPQSAADAPQLKDPNNQQPSYPQDFNSGYKNPAQAKSYPYAPVVVFDAQGNPSEYWQGGKANLNGSATGMSSSLLGPDSISMPGYEFSGARAPTLRSKTEADAVSGGIGPASGSYAWGTTTSLSDFLDLNGDQFPDILGSNAAQFTQPRGGLDLYAIPLTNFDTIRQNSSSTKTYNGGGDAAEIKGNAKGNSAGQASESSGGGRANKGGSKTSGSFGVSASEGKNSTNNFGDGSPGAAIIQSDLQDMNGDGLPDRVRLYSNGLLTVNFNLGYAFDPNQIVWPGGSLDQGGGSSSSLSGGASFSYGSLSFSGGVSVSKSTDQPTSTWTDLNGDGIPDQITNNSGVIRVRFGTGAGLTGPIDFGNWQGGVISYGTNQDLNGGADFTVGIGPLCVEVDLCYIILNPGIHGDGGAGRQEVDVKDVNGDGYPDDVLSVNDSQMQVLLNQTGRTNLLKTVANPLGGSFTLDYTRAGNTEAQPDSQWVMSSVDVNDGRPGDGPDHQLTTYQYANNKYDPLERDVLGYQTVTEEQHDTSVAGNPVLRSTKREYLNSTIFDQGLLASETLLYPNGKPFSETVNTYTMWDVGAQAPANPNPDPAGVGLLNLTVFPQLEKAEFRHFDSNGNQATDTWNTYTYDALGNITTVTDVGAPNLPGDDVTATTTYTDCKSSTWVSLPDSFVVTDGSGKTLRSRHAEVLCSNGAITKLWEDTGNGVALTELSFDKWGNYDHIVYPANQNGQRYTVDYVYDSDRHTSIASVKDSYGLEGAATYDGATGQITSRTDANGQKTSYTYDDYGRLTSITGPYEQGSGNASVTFEYFPTAPGYAYALAHNFDAFHPGDTIDTASFMDGIGRVTETKQDATLFQGANQPAVDAMIVSGATEWDALGRAVKQWYPISESLGTIGVYNYNTAAITPTVVTYDIADRVVKTVAPNATFTTTDYGFGGNAVFGATMSEAVASDQLGRTTTAYVDVRGNQVGTEVNHLAGNTQETLRTLYQYDPLNQLVGVTDSNGNQTTHTYDLLGRRTSTNTPDGGLVTFSYDLASHKISQVTPNLRAANGEIHYNYDFSHLAGIAYTDGTPNVTYTYGGPGAAGNGAGRIIRVTDGARVQQRAYGKQGEVTQETTTMLVHNLIDSTQARLTWTTSFAFDTLGRTKNITYPDGEVVTYGYDSGSLISSVTGEKAGISYPYLLRKEYDEFSATRFSLDGNQVATVTQYDPATRRLSRQIIDAPGRRIQDLNYTYDLTGNVLSSTNNSPTPVSSLMGGPSQQTFTYDDLYRLVSAMGAYSYAPNKTRNYTYNLTYDDIGNILRKTQADAIISGNPKKSQPQLKTSYDQSYSYTAAPHQPTQIGTQLNTFDLNGNFTGWTDTNSGQNRTVTWDAENRVSSVADQGSTTTYAYTDDGTLAIQRGPGGEVAFVNRYYTVYNGSVFWKDIYAGDRRIATKQQMPDGQQESKEYFLHTDLLGSTTLVTDPTGAIYEHLEYFPSGEIWIEENSDVYHVPELYTGSYYDEFRGVYNFGARWYEPVDQMFYSTEPNLVQNPGEVVGDPAVLPAYTYAQSNPVTFIDTNGLSIKAALTRWKAAASNKLDAIRNRIKQVIISLDPEKNEKSARFKAFAEFKFPPAVSYNVSKDRIEIFGINPKSISKKFIGVFHLH
jgi:RHS repeat-associated protein